MKTFEQLNYKVISLTRKELDEIGLDNEEDLRDLISMRLKVEDFEEVMSGWDVDDNNYIVVTKV